MNSSTASIFASLQSPESVIDWQQLLPEITAAFGCSTGTIHTFDKDAKLLRLRAYQGIPPFLVPKLTEIPVGKGIAGIAAERRQPVEMCNLQTDESGVARPAAKETKVEGSIAVPMLLGGELYGTFGIGKPVPYDFTEEERAVLLKMGEEMSRHVHARE